jgi:hypothetical protein
MERRVVPVGAVVLTTFFALLYALRGSIAAIDRGEDPRWAQQVVWSLAMWWTCLPLLPPLAALVRRFRSDARVRGGTRASSCSARVRPPGSGTS